MTVIRKNKYAGVLAVWRSRRTLQSIFVMQPAENRRRHDAMSCGESVPARFWRWPGPGEPTPPALRTSRSRPEVLGGLREAFASDVVQPPDWAAAAGSPRGAGTVLIVEDDPDQLTILDIHLRAGGYPTWPVTRGDEVLDTARMVRPSAVLLDVDLPGFDGHTVCRLMKSDPELSAIPIIFLTTRVSINDKLSGLVLGGGRLPVQAGGRAGIARAPQTRD